MKEIVFCEEITEVVCIISVNVCLQDRATGKADSCKPLTAVVLVRSLATVCELICGGQSGIRKVSYRILLFFPISNI